MKNHHYFAAKNTESQLQGLANSTSISDLFLVFIVVLIVMLYFLNKKLDTLPPHTDMNRKRDDDEEMLTSPEYTDYTDYTSNGYTSYASTSEYSTD